MESLSAIYKLIILYMLDRVDGRIPVPQISNFLLENGYANFASLSSIYEEIAESGLVTMEKDGDRTYAVITETGEETLEFFRNNLSEEARREADSFLKERGRQLRNDEAIVGDYFRSSYGGYTVRLEVRERRKTVFSIELSVPDEDSAREVIRHWKERSSDVYQSIIAGLF